MELVAHILIVTLICHPDPNRHDESQFFTECNFFRQYLCGCCTECHLILLFVYFILGRHSGGNAENSGIRQRHTHFQSGCPAHLIHIQINISFQPDLNIHIGHLAQWIQSFCFLINTSYQFDRQYIRIIMLQDFLFFILFHNIGISNIEILQIFSIALCIAIHIVSTEEFIRTFSGIANLCMLCSLSASKCEYNCRGISKRLFHVVHYIRHNTKIFLRCDHTTLALSSKKLCCLSCKSGFVKSLFFISAGICFLHI